jgi:glucose/arabinose dehydrogenase
LFLTGPRLTNINPVVGGDDYARSEPVPLRPHQLDLNRVKNFRYLRFTVAAAALLCCSTLPAAEQSKQTEPAVPKHDPVGQPFRMAPMSVATRSVVIPLSTNVHLAFDAERLRTHTVWVGESLNLYGPPYHGSSDRFMCDFDGKTLWTTPQLFPWSAGKLSKTDPESVPASARFKGIETKNGNVTLHYEVPAGDGTVSVKETADVLVIVGKTAIRRRFEIASCKQELFLLAHAEADASVKGRPNLAIVERDTGESLLVAVHGDSKVITQKRNVDYPVRLFVEKNGHGPQIEAKTNHVTGTEARIYVRIAGHTKPTIIEVVSLVTATPDAPRFAKLMSENSGSSAPDRTVDSTTNVFSADKTVFPRVEGDKFYRLEHFPLPKEIDLRITGMDFLPNGDLAVCTWPGEIYIIRNFQNDVRMATYHRFARGLMEPLGVKFHQGALYVVQKGELTRITDTDDNGEADKFETINSGWGFTGRYNAFAMGPVIDRSGNFFVFLGGNGVFWDVPYMGWAVKISADGRTLEPFASGLRVPHGFITYGGNDDIFVTENQGNWIGACKLNHLQKGRFYGHPSAWPAPKENFEKKTSFTPPAVWFPYTLAKSTSGIDVINDENFGPFKGQMIVADYQNSIATRVMLEKVDGEWQGTVWPFAKGFGSGVNRIAFGPDSKLYIGGGKGGHWSGAVGSQMQSLDRLSFTGKNPFAVKEVHATVDGFELTFTKPVDATLAAGPDGYLVTQHTYKYHAKYGSPEIDHDGKENSSTEIKVDKAVVSADGLKVHLTLQGHRPGYVTMVRADLTSEDGDSLWQDTFWYTLNNIPKP